MTSVHGVSGVMGMHGFAMRIASTSRVQACGNQCLVQLPDSKRRDIECRFVMLAWGLWSVWGVLSSHVSTTRLTEMRQLMRRSINNGTVAPGQRKARDADSNSAAVNSTVPSDAAIAIRRASESPIGDGRVVPTSDYPAPSAPNQRPFIWDADRPAVALFPSFGARLSQTGDIYRRPGYGSGLLLASPCPAIPPVEITKGTEFAPVITDRLPVLVVKGGKPKGSRIPLTAQLTGSAKTATH